MRTSTRQLERGFRGIAFSLIGTETGGVPPRESVRAMARAFRKYSNRPIEI